MTPREIDLPTPRGQLLQIFWLPVVCIIVGIALLIFGFMAPGGAPIAIGIGAVALVLSVALTIMEIRALQHSRIIIESDAITLLRNGATALTFKPEELTLIQVGLRKVPEFRKKVSLVFIDFQPLDWDSFQKIHPNVGEYIPPEFPGDAFGLYIGKGKARLAFIDQELSAAHIPVYVGQAR